MPISETKMTKTISLDLEGLNREQKTRAKEAAKRIYLEEIQSQLDRSLSPISGGRYKRLKKDGTPSILEENGDMRGSLKGENRRGNDIELGIFTKTQSAKAHGHHTAANNLPFRQVIPGESQSFLKKIENKVDREINRIKRESRVLGDVIDA